MAWRNSPTQASPSSTLSKILPLLILFLVLSVLAIIGFYVYLAANDIADKAGKKLEKKQIVCSRDGVKVNVKHVEDEKYIDQTQRSVLGNGKYRIS